MDCDLDAVDEEEPQAHEQLGERVVRICNIEEVGTQFRKISCFYDAHILHRVSHVLLDWVWLTWILSVLLSGENLAEVAGGGTTKSKSTQTRSTSRWDTL